MPEAKEAETSFKPLSVSSPTSTALTTDPIEQDAPTLKAYAAKRALLLFGCYRKGDANDPDTYTAAVTAVLSRYPEDVIKAVTHPAKGLPIKSKFLPNVAEVFEACEELMVARREDEARRKRIEKQIESRAQFERSIYDRDSAEAKAIKVLHLIAGRMSAYWQIARRPDGKVLFSKPMTEQLTALANADQISESAWVTLTHAQAGAWEELFRNTFDKGIVRAPMREGSKAPWPWPPSIEGRIYTDPGGAPPLTADDYAALANEGQ